MSQILIEGGYPLEGDIYVSGMKNSALPILFSTLLVEGESVIENIPPITDITGTIEILTAMGAVAEWISPTALKITTDGLRCGTAPDELVKSMRGSSYLLGAELGRFGRSRIGVPGGCSFTRRPLDQHIKGFERMGAKVDVGSAGFSAETESGLRAANIFFSVKTVGATVNCILAAARTPGVTVLENAAREPHIVDLANFLNFCGADIRGAGTDVIRIRGVEHLVGKRYRIIPDMIEAGTFMVAAAATGGRVTVRDIIPKHLETVITTLREMDVSVKVGIDSAEVISDGHLLPTTIYTQPYPGFPTDMQPQFAVLCCLTENGALSSITEGVFGERFQYIDELKKMGVNIFRSGGVARIFGVERLNGATVETSDLRAGAAMVIAGLAAKGRTEIADDHEYIARGYSNIVGKLRGIGAHISVKNGS